MKFKELISICLVVSLSVPLFACSDPRFPGKTDLPPFSECEVYPEDLPFEISDFGDEHFIVATEKISNERTMTEINNDNHNNDEYDIVKEFLEYYDSDFSLKYIKNYFFINPNDREACTSGSDRLRESITVKIPYLYKAIASHEYELVEYDPYIYQQYDLRHNPFFTDAYVELSITSYAIDFVQNGDGFEFEYKCKKSRLGGCIPKIICYVEIYINDTYVGYCSAIGDKITKYEVANFLYHNYMILSPETAEE